MKTKNEIQAVKFTRDDILKGLMRLDDNRRQAISNISLEQLSGMVNNPKYLQEVYNNCDTYIVGYQKMKDAIKDFVEMVHIEKFKGKTGTIDDMVEKYKNFSREDRLKFNKKLLDVSELENSVDTFKYAWNKLMKTLNAVKA